MRVEMRLNGAPRTVDVEPQELLLDVLRDRLLLTGAKRSCDVQVCGTCTVLVDGAPVSACTWLAACIARFSPLPYPIPMRAGPAFCMTAFTSAKSTLIWPVLLITSVIHLAAVASTLSALSKAARIFKLPNW